MLHNIRASALYIKILTNQPTYAKSIYSHELLKNIGVYSIVKEEAMPLPLIYIIRLPNTDYSIIIPEGETNNGIYASKNGVI